MWIERDESAGRINELCEPIRRQGRPDKAPDEAKGTTRVRRKKCGLEDDLELTLRARVGEICFPR